jgi:hypothetical protein
MEDLGNLDRGAIGIQLHQAELAIGIGRRTIKELVASEPVDYVAVAIEKANVQQARLARNVLKTQLYTAHINEPLGRYVW